MYNEKENIRVALYSRKSKYSEKGDSIGNQVELAKEYISVHYPKEEYNVEISIYEDEGFSGGSFNRPQFKKFIADERNNPFNVLICYRLDRISRNIADFSSLINELTELQTSFVSIKEQFDTKTPMGRAMMYIASVFAQLEREVITERIRDNLLELAKTGIWLGGAAPLGFSSERYQKVDVCENENDCVVKKSKTASKLVVNPEEIEHPKIMYYKYLELKSMKMLETYLINNEIKTKNGKYYDIKAIKRVLTNITYAQNDDDIKEYFEDKGIYLYAENDGRNKFDGKYGFLTYNKSKGKHQEEEKPMNEWIIAVGLHPGIIPGKDWIAVQSLIEKNASKSFRATSIKKEEKQTIVAGLIKCKLCGSRMRARNMERKRSDGTVNYRYCCYLKEKSRGVKCNCLNVNGRLLDGKIKEILKETFTPNSLVYKELKKIANSKGQDIEKNELIIAQKEYEKVKKEIDNLVEKIKYIDIDLMDVINNNLRKLKERKNQLEKQIKELKEYKICKNQSLEIKTATDILKIIDNSFEIFDKFDLKTKKDIASLFIEDIYGNGEDVEINFLNTKLSEANKKTFIPIVENHFFLNPSLPAKERSIAICQE